LEPRRIDEDYDVVFVLGSVFVGSFREVLKYIRRRTLGIFSVISNSIDFVMRRKVLVNEPGKNNPKKELVCWEFPRKAF
jgi:hypothetical protein